MVSSRLRWWITVLVLLGATSRRSLRSSIGPEIPWSITRKEAVWGCRWFAISLRPTAAILQWKAYLAEAASSSYPCRLDRPPSHFVTGKSLSMRTQSHHEQKNEWQRAIEWREYRRSIG